jgi:hypothetical protein
MTRAICAIECPACDGGRERVDGNCSTCHGDNYVDKSTVSVVASYRENAKISGITELPVTVSPPPGVPSFWMITDGSAYVCRQGGLTMEPEDAVRYPSRADADTSFTRQGTIAKRTMHILRVDCATTVTDETFNERNRS